MRKFFYSLIACAILLGVVTSCDKDEFTEDDALANDMEYQTFLRDSLAVYGIIEYTVKVFDASENSIATSTKSTEDAGLAGVAVSIAQNGYVLTDTTDATGMVVFEDMRIGSVNVTISADGYTDVSYIADITPTTSNVVNTSSSYATYSVASAIAVFSETENLATIEGVITYESDLTNTAREYAGNVSVIATIDASSSDFEKYMLLQESYFTSTYYNMLGTILQMSYVNTVAAVETSSTGAYSIQVPSAPDGVPYQISVDEFAVEQSILLNTLNGQDVYGVQSIRTIFGESITPSAIPTVAPAYVTFGSPSGVIYDDPTETATATAIVENSGIESIEITDPGLGYTQAPKVVIESETGTGAAATAVLDSKGHVVAITMTSNGEGYVSGATTVSLEDNVADAIVDVNVTYEITEINVTSSGSGYASAPTVTIFGGEVNATATAIMSGYVSTITVSNHGSGYNAVPSVFITGGGGSGATASASLNGDGTIDINITNGGSGYTSAPTIVIVAADGDTGVSAVATTSLAYFVDQIVVTSAGSGYTSSASNRRVKISAPADAAGTTATATSVIGNGVVSSVKVSYGGSGYTAAPNLNLDGGGFDSPAIISLTVSGGAVTSASIDYEGDGYTSDPSAEVKIYQEVAAISADDNLTAGAITSIVVNDGGKGYAVPPMVVIDDLNGVGKGATAEANINDNGTVTSISVTNGGSGYYTAPAVTLVVPNNTTTATGYVTVSEEGTIESVSIIDGGMGYSTAPTVTITGADGGSGATATAVVSGGEVTSVRLTNSGSGYLGQNTPGSWGGSIGSNRSATTSGKGISIYNDQSVFIANKSYVIDMYLGTGQRVED